MKSHYSLTESHYCTSFCTRQVCDSEWEDNLRSQHNRDLHGTNKGSNLSEALGTTRCHCKRLSGRSWWVMEGTADSVKQQAVNRATNTLFIIINVEKMQTWQMALENKTLHGKVYIIEINFCRSMTHFPTKNSCVLANYTLKIFDLSIYGDSNK